MWDGLLEKRLGNGAESKKPKELFFCDLLPQVSSDVRLAVGMRRLARRQEPVPGLGLFLPAGHRDFASLPAVPRRWAGGHAPAGNPLRGLRSLSPRAMLLLRERDIKSEHVPDLS